MLIRGAHSGYTMELPGCAPGSKPPRLTDTDRPRMAPELRAGHTVAYQAAPCCLAITRMSTHASSRGRVRNSLNQSAPAGLCDAPPRKSPRP